MTTPDAEGLGAELAARLRLVVARLARQLRRHARGGGPSPGQWSALSALERYGPMRMGDLADREGIGAPTATRLVTALEGEGLLERVADPRDRRSALVRITPAGARALAEERRERTSLLARKLAALDVRDLRRIAELLPVLEALVDEPVDQAARRARGPSAPGDVGPFGLQPGDPVVVGGEQR